MPYLALAAFDMRMRGLIRTGESLTHLYLFGMVIADITGRIPMTMKPQHAHKPYIIKVTHAGALSPHIATRPGRRQ